ncbi:hypothetical protein EIK79_07975 [Halocatena pleomorpha]|uniref:Uncharacterized protein n=1 Tax=Halocatena pleomorpha TaxID=1785090 RepID=A0A3P3RCF1_9EURY|nr:hypothetical protein [Halocatena pleomorpha]RRJ31162.1 hypothetical protein EIK79_07975 [Halocatena pleomorpha]
MGKVIGVRCPSSVESFSYADREAEENAQPPTHEITVTLCRWCHARVHDSWARVDDAVSPSKAAIAAREARRTCEQAEFEFQSAAERQ